MREDGVLLAHGQCIEQYGAGEAYMPILDALERLCRAQTAQQITDVLRRVAPSWLANLPSLVSAEERSALQRQAIGITPERRLREIGGFLEEIARDQTVVLILEDLHWLDPSSLALISFLARRPEAARLMVIGTYRAGEVERLNHPLKAVAAELELHHFCVHLPLKLLSRGSVEEYLAARFETPAVSSSVLATVYGRSEGNPLFMVNVTDYLVSREAIVQENGAVKLTPIKDQDAVPGTIRDLIERQFEGLTDLERELLEAASVAGTTFSVSVVARVLERPRDMMEERFRALAEREQFIQQSTPRRSPAGNFTARYTFLHALYQNVIYDRVGDARRSRLHLSIGERMEAVYQGATEIVAAELALHFERGGNPLRAVKYLLQSAQLAVRQSAFRETLDYCERGKALLKLLDDDTQRAAFELGFQLAAGVSHSSMLGYAAAQANDAYLAARKASVRVRKNEVLLFQALAGLWSFHLIRGQLREALALARQMLKLAIRSPSKPLLVNGHMTAGIALFYLGRMADANNQLQRSSSYFDPEHQKPETSIYGWDPGVLVGCYRAQSLWLLGDSGHDLTQARNGNSWADQLGVPFHQASANGLLAMYRTYRGEPHETLSHAETTIKACTEYGIPHWLALGILLKGWALARLGQTTEGLRLLEEGIGRWKATGAQMVVPPYLALHAEAYQSAGKTKLALQKVDEAFAISQRNSEHYYDAELCRIKGELLSENAIRHSDRRLQEAERWLLRAVRFAQDRNLRSHELRAATSLARLSLRAGKTNRAVRLLANAYKKLPRRADTPDIKAAKALLDELAAGTNCSLGKFAVATTPPSTTKGWP